MYNNFIRLVNELSEMGGKKLLSTPQKEVKSESEFRNKKKIHSVHTQFFHEWEMKKIQQKQNRDDDFFPAAPSPSPFHVY